MKLTHNDKMFVAQVLRDKIYAYEHDGYESKERDIAALKEMAERLEK